MKNSLLVSIAALITKQAFAEECTGDMKWQPSSECKNEFYILDQNCECMCGIICLAIYSIDSERCECVPIPGLECHSQYNGQFCDEDGNIYE